ncbi:unnamed protein product [Urochloa humidicola]
MGQGQHSATQHPQVLSLFFSMAAWLDHDPVGHCTKPQLRQGEGIHDKLDKDAVLDGKSVCSCDQTWWALALS